MRLKAKFFGWARELAGVEGADMEVPEGISGAHLLKLLEERYPELKRVTPIASLSVNMEYTPLDNPLQEGDEVALIPPVSGGA